MDKVTLWLIVGFMGQMFFSARFFLQWINSRSIFRNKKKKRNSYWFLVFFSFRRSYFVCLCNSSRGSCFYSRTRGWVNNLF